MHVKKEGDVKSGRWVKKFSGPVVFGCINPGCARSKRNNKERQSRCGCGMMRCENLKESCVVSPFKNPFKNPFGYSRTPRTPRTRDATTPRRHSHFIQANAHINSDSDISLKRKKEIKRNKLKQKKLKWNEKKEIKTKELRNQLYNL